MKNRHIRAVALTLALVMLLSGAFSGKALAADPAASRVNIPYGGDISAYNPERDGYYGLLPVQYEESQDEDGLKTMAQAYMPVLVYDSHLYIADSEIQSVLGLSVKKGGETLLISAYERHLALGSGSAEAQFFAGDFADSYIALTMHLSAAPIYNNGSVWVPLQDLCILFDLGLHQETDGEDTFLTVYDPDETVIDVLAFLYNHSSECMTAYTSGNLALLSGSSAAAQMAAKLLEGDATAWAALALSSFGMDEKAYELLLEQLADNLTVDLMCVIPDESAITAKKSADYISDVLSLVQMETDLGANAVVDLELMDAVLEARLSSSDLVDDPRWFSEALDKIDALTEQKKALASLNSGIDNVLTGVKTVFGMLQTAATYASVDDLSLGGVAAICANKEYLTYSNPVVLDEIESYAAFMQSGAVNYSLYDYVSKNVGSWVLDGLSASCPVFKLMQLSTHLVPALAEGIDATESFQISMLAIPLQSDVERVLQAELKAYPARKAEAEEFQVLSETAYIFLKTCYIAKNQATAALQLSGDDLATQQAQMEFLLEKMAVLSVNYRIAPENAYSKSYRLQDIDDSALLDNCIKKMYLQVSGTVVREADGSPVEDAHCEIIRAGELCGFFDGTPGGSYAGKYVPLLRPAGCIPYTSEFPISASLSFTSPTVDGEDTVTAESAPGAAVNPVETACLGYAEGFAIASPMGVIDGTLYSVDTQYIEESAGIQELQLPTDGAGDFYPVRFAYYGGKIYFVEKTPGTDDLVQFRLCRCEKDGSGRTVLVEDGLTWGILNFMIENNVIAWEQYDFNAGADFYRVYNIAEGRLLDGKGIPQPLTKFVTENYDADSVVLLDNGDGTQTLYHQLRNSESAESLSQSLVTIDDGGNVSVQPFRTEGHIEGASSLFAVCDGYAYMTAYEGSMGNLYKLNLNDPGDLQLIGSHMAAGGGDAFFNY